MVDATDYKVIISKKNELKISVSKKARDALKAAPEGSMEAVAAKSPLYNAVAQRGLAALPDPALVGSAENSLVISQPLNGEVGTIWQQPEGENALFQELAEKGTAKLNWIGFSGASLPDSE